MKDSKTKLRSGAERADGTNTAHDLLREETPKRERTRTKTKTLLRRYQLLMQTAIDGVHIMDDQGNIVDANDTFCRRLGYTREEMSKLNVVDWDARWSAKEMRARLKSLIGKSGMLETVHRRKDGALIDVEISFTCVEIEGQHLFFCSSRDITERKQSEAALRASAASMRAILDNFPYLVWLKDSQGRYITVNKAFAEYFKLDILQFTGKTDLDFQKRELAEKYRADDAEVMAARQQKYIEEPSFDGEKTHWVETYKTPIIDEDGKVLGTVGFARDITERKEIEAVLKQRKTIIETTSDGFWMCDLSGNLLEVNQAYADMIGYTKEELTGMHISKLSMLAPSPESVRAKMEEIVNLGVGYFETQHRHKDGRAIDLDVSAAYLPESKTIFSFLRNITERKRVQRELQRSHALLNEAQQLGKLGTWELDLLSGELRWSDEVYRIFELDPAQFSPSYENFLNVIHPDDRDRVNLVYTKSLEDKQPYDIVHRLLFPDGYVKWAHEHCATEFDAAGKPLRSLGAVQDVTVQHMAEDSLRVAAAAFETHEGILITDADANIIRVNRAFQDITGYSAEEVLGKNPRMLSSGRQDKTFYAGMWRQLLDVGSWSGEIWDKRKNGQIYPKWLTITAVKNESGKTTEYVGMFSDITARKEAEEEIRNLAFYDALTKLPNRRLLLDRFNLALSVSARSQHYGAVLFLDLDRFKTINDTLGHDHGDLMLIEVAQRIQSCVREVDTVARLGGDEFVVLVEEVGANQEDVLQKIALIAEKIRLALTVPYQIKGYEYHSSPSIGVCLYRGNEESVDDLLKHADLAMYQAKDSGRNAVRFFDPLMQQAVEIRAALEVDLRSAISNQQLHLNYQIQVDNDHRPMGAEALLRWTHPVRGLVSPAQFIPIAEESSLMLGIGHWVLETACQQLALWNKHEKTRDLTIAVNVSAQQFRSHDFVEKVAGAVRAHQVDPTRLKLELTESVVLSNVSDVVAKMHALKGLGVRLSLDDFGTGYSSLSYLKQLPLDQLKIDQTFVRDITSDPNDAVLVQTIIDMARNFRLNVIAEGVETEAQLDFLKQHGCMAYQGYLFGKPVPIDEFEALLDRM